MKNDFFQFPLNIYTGRRAGEKLLQKSSKRAYETLQVCKHQFSFELFSAILKKIVLHMAQI